MKPLFAVGGLYTEASGVARIVCDLANALGRHDAPVTVYAANCKGRETAEHLLVPPSRAVIEPGQWLFRLSHSPKLSGALERDVESFDIVHSHSVWMLPNHYASNSARKHRRPMIFTAHGALEPWAIARSRWKKKIVGMWFQDRDLRDAACLHVNSKIEAQGIRAYGLRNPIAIVPNGVDLAPFASLPQRSEFEREFPSVIGKRVLLFLSRLHPKKGLEPLLNAWRRVASDHQDWHLIIAGPDDGFESQAKEMVSDLASVTFTGPRFGAQKIAMLAAADAFVLPSFSEGFSMAVLEAMACGLPVLITPGCNFPEAACAGAGLEVTAGEVELAQGLRTLFGMSCDQRKSMGANGRRLVEQHYTWDAVALQMKEIYQWMIGGGAMPSTVHKAA